MSDEARSKTTISAEQRRLDEAREKGVPWQQWGPYLTELQWGTVREDYREKSFTGWSVGERGANADAMA